MLRRFSDSSNDSNEAKRPKMDVPPPNCLRTRRPGVASIRGKGRGSSNNSEDRLGSLSGQFPLATEVNARDEAGGSNIVKHPLDTHNNLTQDVVAKDTNLNPATSDVHVKPKEKQTKSPIMLLNEYYAKLHVKTDRSNYNTIQHGNIVKFTSVFTSPSTGERFMSGRLKEKECFEEDGVVWYGKLLFQCHQLSLKCKVYHVACPSSNTMRTLYVFIFTIKANKQSARTAVAARAMDCFTFRVNVQHNSSVDDATFCLDAPYLKDQGPNVPTFLVEKLPADKIEDQNVAEAKVDEKRVEVQSQQTNADDAPTSNELQSNAYAAVDCNDENVSSIKASLLKQSKSANQLLDEHYAKLKCPKQELNEYYNNQLGQQISQLKNYYVVWEHRFAKAVRYTCIFVCPISLEAFVCGHLPGKNEDVILDESLFWYNSKQLARDAAAAKALGENEIIDLLL